MQRYFIYGLFLFILSLIISCVDDSKAVQGFSKNAKKNSLKKISFEKKRITDKKYLLGKFDYKKDTAFIEVSEKYANGKGKFLLKNVAQAFYIMSEAAKKQGVILKAISCTRNFNEQKNIWEAKWNGKRLVSGRNLAKTEPDLIKRARIILTYSSMPGTSRHHWGTDIDINSVDKTYFNSVEGKKVLMWLENNAHIYGFCRPYSVIDGALRNSGYEEEQWHWSYYQEANRMLKDYLDVIKYSDLTGFSGCETAEKNEVIQKFVSGVSKKCFD